jgi:hypothetical protein
MTNNIKMALRLKNFIFRDDNIDIFNQQCIDQLSKSNYNCLKIFENPGKNDDTSVFFDLSNLPKNIVSLEIYDKFAIIANIPKHIKNLYLIDAAKFVNIPSTIKELYIKTSYHKKFPEVLNLIPYGIKTFTFQTRVFEKNQEYNLDMLPDSIELLILKSSPDTKNKFLINKMFPKLKNIEYHHFIHSSEEEFKTFDLEVVDKDLYDYINYYRINLYIGY